LFLIHFVLFLAQYTSPKKGGGGGIFKLNTYI
jgi:hypothetical protein